ncbi:hypothetical protein Gogos_008830, partial [Gossypium gossypioides]|nr:hypothetical protein [Gossypium gossypioides]
MVTYVCNRRRSHARSKREVDFRLQPIFGICSALEAELWAIFNGLTLILDWRHDKVLMNTDSMETVRAIQDTCFRDSNSALIKRIQQLLTNANQWHIQHISREDNKIIDYLAKITCNKNNDIKLFDQPP